METVGISPETSLRFAQRLTFAASIDLSASASGSISITLGSNSVDTTLPFASSAASSSTTKALEAPETASSTGSGQVLDDYALLSSASACNSAKISWSAGFGRVPADSSTTYVQDFTRTSLSTIETGFTESILVGNNSRPYTLCDGFPRIDISTTYRQSKTVLTEIPTTTEHLTTEAFSSVSPPACTIAPRECSFMLSSYSSASSVFASWSSQYFDVALESQTATLDANITRPDPVYCDSVTALPAPAPWATLPHPACQSNKATVQLLYWPVETVGNRLCGNYSTISAKETLEGTANTAESYDTTFTSPTVYMVFKGAYSILDNFQTGSSYQAILPLSPASVSSICGQLDGSFGPPQSVNYADFNSPVPASAYRCQPKCFGHLENEQFGEYRNVTENVCSTIYDNYHPALEIPTAAISSYFTSGLGLQLNGDGLHCSFNPDLKDGVIFDPPKALQQVASIALPTRPGVVVEATTPASPATKPTTFAGPTKLAAGEPTREASRSDGDDAKNSNDTGDSYDGEHGTSAIPTPTLRSDDQGSSNRGPSRQKSNDVSSSSHLPIGSGGGGDSRSTERGSSGNSITADHAEKGNSKTAEEPARSIGDIIASALGMVSQTRSTPTRNPGHTDSSEQFSENDSDLRGQGSDALVTNDGTRGQLCNGSKGDGKIQSTERSQGSGKSTASIEGLPAATGSSGQAAHAAAQVDIGDEPSVDGASENISSDSDSREDLAQSPNNSIAQVAVITGQNNRVVTATLSSGNVILPQTTLALDQGATDVLGLGRISADEQGIAVDEGEVVAFALGSEASSTPSESSENRLPVLTLDDQSFTLASATKGSGFVVADASNTLTLIPGSTAMLDGTTLALLSASEASRTDRALPSVVVVNEQTVTLGALEVDSTATSTHGGSSSDVGVSEGSQSSTQIPPGASSSADDVSDSGAKPLRAPVLTVMGLLLALIGGVAV
ncbi:hypothetical protein MBLNU230_g4169t1 [Neophaeotheca triangularis]